MWGRRDKCNLCVFAQCVRLSKIWTATHVLLWVDPRSSSGSQRQRGEESSRPPRTYERQYLSHSLLVKKTGDACGSRCCRSVNLLKLWTGEEKGGGERQRGPCQMQQDRFASEWAWLLIGFKCFVFKRRWCAAGHLVVGYNKCTKNKCCLYLLFSNDPSQNYFVRWCPFRAFANAITAAASKNASFQACWEGKHPPEGLLKRLEGGKMRSNQNCKDWSYSHFWTGENKLLIGSLVTTDW